MRTSIVVLFCIFLCNIMVGQVNASFQSLIYSRSIPSAGMGEQGAASHNAFSAMQYNPANLVYSDNFSLSYFYNPWDIIGWHIPLRSFNASAKIEGLGSFGLEYTYWNFGDMSYTTPSSFSSLGYAVETYQFYERSVAAGYATSLGDHCAIGAQVRYVWEPTDPSNTIDHILFSAGISSTPAIFSDRISLGLSLMNLGTAIEYNYQNTLSGSAISYTSSAAPPAQLNLGIETLPVKNEFFDINCSLGAMKPLVKFDDQGNARSSFNALFTDWNDFPEDMTAQIGLGMLWHPLDLGGGFAFFQEMYLGYITRGPKESLTPYDGFFTHGITVGIQYHSVKASAGYAGRWHNNNSSSYSTWYLPWETFQFTLSTNFNKSTAENDVTNDVSPLKRIVLSTGCTYGDPFGKMNEYSIDPIKISYSPTTFISLESDFYLSDNSAILTAVQYGRMKRHYDFGGLAVPTFIPIAITVETVSIESGFRYHPIEQIHPLFMQGSFGIIRMNPTINILPKYYYQTFAEVAIGCIVPITNSGLVVMPRVGLKTIFMNEYSNANNLGCYNQFTLGVNVGYEL